MSFFFKQLKRGVAKGFTLIEMLVVIAIFTIMTGIILANLPEFRDQTSLELLAQQMAINIRTVQVYGVATRISNDGQADRFGWYGIRFSLADQGASVVNRSVSRMFSDVVQDGKYDETTDVAEFDYRISNGYEITNICAVSSQNPNCVDMPGGMVDVVYRRPNPEATFCSGVNSTCAYNWDNFSEIYIKIGRISDGKRWKCLKVSSNGQIAVLPGFKLEKDAPCYLAP
ncbi:MAG TPA: prepilin-type N-terminal cleavage/methylation domain-containing protein [Candidatus Paceibacterota bacterium]|nr:prepilin-type N-terminal cleavage/methylation domain-containing protein [Candidatus Paceibacterota bacterium]